METTRGSGAGQAAVTAPPTGTPPTTPPGLTAAISDTLAGLIDGISDLDRMMSCLSAARAELIDTTRQWCETTNLAVPPTGGPRWDPRTTARMVLVTEIGAALRLPDRTTESLITDSETLLHDLPGTLAALRAGRITYRHATTMIDHATTLPTESRAAFEAAALDDAEHLTVAKFDRKARTRREHAHPDSITARHTIAATDRNIRSHPGRDGMAWLNAYLPAPDIAGIMTRTTAIAENLKAPDETRTVTQLQADAFTDLLTHGHTHTLPTGGTGEDGPHANGDGTASRRCGAAGIGAGIIARVFVTVPVLTLLGQDNTPGTLEGYGPIDPDTARQLAATAPSFTRILTHPETGTILSIGRNRYPVPRDLRTWLRIRDQTCRFPGCNRTATRCDIDHTLDWHHGGHTAHNNLAHLFPRHHALKHNTAWTPKHAGNGTVNWTSPSRHHYTTEPATHLPTTPTPTPPTPIPPTPIPPPF